MSISPFLPKITSGPDCIQIKMSKTTQYGFSTYYQKVTSKHIYQNDITNDVIGKKRDMVSKNISNDYFHDNHFVKIKL